MSRKAATLVAPAATAVGALGVLAGVHAAVVDAGADVVLVASLLTLAHSNFRLVDDLDVAPADGGEAGAAEQDRGRASRGAS